MQVALIHPHLQLPSIDRASIEQYLTGFRGWILGGGGEGGRGYYCGQYHKADISLSLSHRSAQVLAAPLLAAPHPTAARLQQELGLISELSATLPVAPLPRARAHVARLLFIMPSNIIIIIKAPVLKC